VVQQFALVCMLQGLVWTVGGTQVTRTLLFPLAFLWFAVPIGEFLVPLLQDVTALFTVQALRLSGIPVLLEGRLLTVPSGTWRVAEACSGVRYLIAAVALSCLYAAMAYRSWGRRIGFILASLVVPILMNSARAYGIVILAHLSGNRLATGVDHVTYGWLFFGVVMSLLLWLGSRWREAADGKRVKAGQRLSLPPAQTSSLTEPDRRQTWSIQALALTAAGGIGVLALAPFSASVMSTPPEQPLVIRPEAPQVRLPWQASTKTVVDWTPRFVGADAEVMQSYTTGVQTVRLYIAYYASQRQGAEVINSTNDLTHGKQWMRIAEGYTYATVDGRRLAVHESTLQSWQSHRLVWSWYWVAGTFTANPYWAKLLQAKARLGGGGQSAAVIALGADYYGHRSEAAAALQDFLLHSASLQTALRRFSQ
jgi:EpsI family protein